METQTNNWYAIKQNTNEEGTPLASAEISIYDEIGGWGVTAKDFIEELNALGEVEDISLRINSPGGSIIEGNVIFNAIRRISDSGANVVVYIDGLAASMASVIAMAGDEIHMAANAFLMIHNPWTVSIGDSDQLRADAELMDKMKLNIINAYSRSNYTADELTALMDAETWLTADEALEAGFIDKIEGANLAAASLTDINHKLAKIETKLPLDKQLAVMTAKYEDAIETLGKEIESNLDELAKNATEIQGLQAEKDMLNDCIQEMDTTHKAELEEAQNVTDEAVAAKAAELVNAQTVEPVAIDDSADKPIENKGDFWSQYEAVKANGDRIATQKWYQENKHLIGK